MAKFITLRPEELKELRSVDERLVSYNIEMTEVTGGTFWKEYTKEQINGEAPFGEVGSVLDFTSSESLMQYYPGINLYDEKLRYLARSLGAAWVRVSGSWATKTYYAFGGEDPSSPPKGYYGVLTKEAWIGVLDFVKDIGAKLLISVSNCEGDHENGGPLDLTQTKKIFDLSHEYGVDIDAAEFMNEPNMLEFSGAPKGYTAEDYARDQDIFASWVKKNYPKCIVVGPCAIGDADTAGIGKKASAGIGAMADVCTAEKLLADTKVKLDVFSYHYYNGVSERLEAMMPSAHWSYEQAHTDQYLSVAEDTAKAYAALRDKYVGGDTLWVTESGDAGGGGNTWASTYLDVFRTLNELGAFCEISNGIIFHNTLASSDYGFLSRNDFEPRPNYFAVLLWNRLMGEKVYDCSALRKDGLRIYCHSRKDGREGYAYLLINNSKTDVISLTLKSDATLYALSPDGRLRSPHMLLGNRRLELGKNGELPPLEGRHERAGSVELMPSTCNFIII